MEPLTKREIDRRIDDLVAEIAAGGTDPLLGEPSRPRWIAPAELVRRIQPFIVHN
jgi:hypothetical protein